MKPIEHNYTVTIHMEYNGSCSYDMTYSGGSKSKAISNYLSQIRTFSKEEVKNSIVMVQLRQDGVLIKSASFRTIEEMKP